MYMNVNKTRIIIDPSSQHFSQFANLQHNQKKVSQNQESRGFDARTYLRCVAHCATTGQKEVTDATDELWCCCHRFVRECFEALGLSWSDDESAFGRKCISTSFCMTGYYLLSTSCFREKETLQPTFKSLVSEAARICHDALSVACLEGTLGS